MMTVIFNTDDTEVTRRTRRRAGQSVGLCRAAPDVLFGILGVHSWLILLPASYSRRPRRQSRVLSRHRPRAVTVNADPDGDLTFGKKGKRIKGEKAKAELLVSLFPLYPFPLFPQRFYGVMISMASGTISKVIGRRPMISPSAWTRASPVARAWVVRVKQTARVFSGTPPRQACERR